MRMRVNIYKSDIAVSMKKYDEEEDYGENEEDNENNLKITLSGVLDNLVLDTKPDVENNTMLGDTSLEEVGGLEEGQVMMMYVMEGGRDAKDSTGFVERDKALNIQAKDTDFPVPVAGNVWGEECMDNEGNSICVNSLWVRSQTELVPTMNSKVHFYFLLRNSTFSTKFHLNIHQIGQTY